MFARGAGNTRSNDMAKSTREAVRMKGGISFAIQKTPKTTSKKFTEPRLMPLPVSPATVVVQSFTLGKPAFTRSPPLPYDRKLQADSRE